MYLLNYFISPSYLVTVCHRESQSSATEKQSRHLHQLEPSFQNLRAAQLDSKPSSLHLQTKQESRSR